MSLNASNVVYFKSTISGNTITFAGNSINTSLTFDGIGGDWTLQDSISCTGNNTFSINNGKFNSNGYMRVGSFQASSTSTVNISNSFIYLVDMTTIFLVPFNSDSTRFYWSVPTFYMETLCTF